MPVEGLIKQTTLEQAVVKCRAVAQKESGEAEKTQAAREKQNRAILYCKCFVELAAKYFGITKAGLAALDVKELTALGDAIYEKAQISRKRKMPFYFLLGVLTLPLLGLGILILGMILTEVFSKTGNDGGTNAVVTYEAPFIKNYHWFKEEFGSPYNHNFVP